jgi:hypothetical protein
MLLTAKAYKPRLMRIAKVEAPPSGFEDDPKTKKSRPARSKYDENTPFPPRPASGCFTLRGL